MKQKWLNRGLQSVQGCKNVFDYLVFAPMMNYKNEDYKIGISKIYLFSQFMVTIYREL